MEFIKKKAKFDAEMSGETREVSTTVEKIKQTLFGLFPFASVIFARSNDNEVLGFALYHKRYSSFSGKPSIWLDDLYVNSTSRSKGVGLELMQSLKHTSKSINASHIAWNASVKNSRGKKFYERFGAELVSTENSALLYRYLIQD